MYVAVKICSFDSSRYFPPNFQNAPKARHIITGQKTKTNHSGNQADVQECSSFHMFSAAELIHTGNTDTNNFILWYLLKQR